MLEQLFFVLGLCNNLLLIVIFFLRKRQSMDAMRRVGYVYLALAIPAIYGLYLVTRTENAARHGIFLGIFLAFLALEALYDFVLTVPFRQNWKLLTPYLVLYYAMNYGFVVMVWKTNLAGGILMLVLFVVQIVVNVATHGKFPWEKAPRQGAGD
jgi:hypothetical protein